VTYSRTIICTGFEDLTARERDVVALVLRGCADKQIAARLGVSPSTIRTHVRRIYAKLAVGNRVELARRAHLRRVTRAARSASAPDPVVPPSTE